MTRPPVLHPDRFAALVALALRLGVDRLPAALRAAGQTPGPELAVLRALLPATTGQHRTTLAPVTAPGDGDLVPRLALTFAQAGESLGVSERQVRRLVAAGELRAVTIGDRTRRIPAGELSDYLARQLEDRAS